MALHERTAAAVCASSIIFAVNSLRSLRKGTVIAS